MTVNETRLYATTDAAVWAEEFCKAARMHRLPHEQLDEGWMLGWFANAIETAKTLEGKRIHDEGLVWSTTTLPDGTEVGGQWVSPSGMPPSAIFLGRDGAQYLTTDEARTAVFEALGEASMCWQPRPAGVFDSRHAEDVGNRLMAQLLLLPVPDRKAKRKALRAALKANRAAGPDKRTLGVCDEHKGAHSERGNCENWRFKR